MLPTFESGNAVVEEVAAEDFHCQEEERYHYVESQARKVLP